MPVEVWFQIDELLTGARKDGSQELIGIERTNEVSHVFAVDSQSDHTRGQPPPGNDCGGNRQERMRRSPFARSRRRDRWHRNRRPRWISGDDTRLGRRQAYPSNLVGILRSGFDGSQPVRAISRAVCSMKGTQIASRTDFTLTCTGDDRKFRLDLSDIDESLQHRGFRPMSPFATFLGAIRSNGSGVRN